MDVMGATFAAALNKGISFGDGPLASLIQGAEMMNFCGTSFIPPLAL